MLESEVSWLTAHQYSSPLFSSEVEPEVTPVPPTAEEVYAVISQRLDLVLGRLGYTRGRAGTSPWWFLDDARGRLFLSVQVDAKATDPYAGGGVRFELERGNTRVPYEKLNGRAMFFQLLTADELQRLITHQNRVIASLSPPPTSHVNLYGELLREQYLSYFRPQTGFDSVKCWLRFHDLEQVGRWMDVLEPLLPVIHDRALSILKSDELYLGRQIALVP